MEQTGISLDQVKKKNRAYILKTINDAGPISKKDIAQGLHLTAASLTQTCAPMIDNGLIYETGTSKEAQGPGRRKVLLAINYDYQNVYSIVIEPEMTNIAITNLKGDLRAIRTLETRKDVPAEIFLNEIADICLELKARAGLEEIAQAGVCISGLVDKKKKVSVHAYGIWDAPVNVGEILEARLGVPVLLENNVTAFAGAEVYFGLGKENDNLLFIKWGPGIGSAIVTGRRIYEGEFKKAAEIGHFIIEKDGQLCSCGRRGCLETKISYGTIKKDIGRFFSQEKTPKLYSMLDGDIENLKIDFKPELFVLCDDIVKDFMLERIDLFARVIINCMTVLAPSKVVLCGPMFKSEFLRERVIEGCSYYDAGYNSENIIHTALADQEYYIGGAALCAKDLLFGD